MIFPESAIPTENAVAPPAAVPSAKAPAAKGKVVNSVGAGDSMVGGFLAALEQGDDLMEALAFGTASGGATAFSVGIANFEKIMEIYETVKTGVYCIE